MTLRNVAMLLCSLELSAYVLRPRLHWHDRTRAHDAPSSISCCDVAPADEGGLLAGPWWDAFREEAELEAAEVGVVIERMAYAGGTLSIHASGGGIDQLQALNSHLSSFIDAQDEDDALPPFLLEVSSPGLSSSLSSDRDFAAFKGFPVTATMTEPFKGKTRWEGTLVGRDDEFVTVNLKGRLQKLPRALVGEVCLPASKTEAGDPYS